MLVLKIETDLFDGVGRIDGGDSCPDGGSCFPADTGGGV